MCDARRNVGDPWMTHHAVMLHAFDAWSCGEIGVEMSADRGLSWAAAAPLACANLSQHVADPSMGHHALKPHALDASSCGEMNMVMSMYRWMNDVRSM